MKKYLSISNIFFVTAFTIAIFSFSMGQSVIKSYQKRLDRYDLSKNKIISFQNVDNYSIEKLKNSLKDEKISITLQKYINQQEQRDSYTISTIVKGDGINILAELKSGKYITKEEYLSEKLIGVFSNTLADDKNFSLSYYDRDEKIDINLEKKGVTFSSPREVYLTNNLFFKIANEDNIALNNYFIILSGEPDEIEKAINNINNDIKNISSTGEVIAADYFIDNRTFEGDMLIKSSIIIIIITIINSICISKLWIKNKRKELVMRMVCGARRIDIFKIFYFELLILSIVSFVIAMLMHIGLSSVTSGALLNMDIRISISNFINSLILSVFVAFLAAIPSINYITEIQPIELLKEE